LERRKNPRFRMNLLCRLNHAAGEDSAQLLDIAEGGLAVRTSAAANQGDAVRVTITPKGAPPITVETLAWHTRRRRAADGRAVFVMGLVISQTSEAYDALVGERATLSEPMKDPRPLRPPRPLKPLGPARDAAETAPLPRRPPLSAQDGAPGPMAAEAPPEPAASNAEPPLDDLLESLRMFRIRLAQGSPTRSVCIAAADEAEARRASLEGFGTEWSVLEIAER
jgi:hypothetical protein